MLSFSQGILLLSPLNVAFFGIFRPAELLLISGGILGLKYKQVIIIGLVLLFLMVNVLLGTAISGDLIIERLIFVFKYTLPFLAFYHGINSKDSNRNYVFALYLISISLWAISYSSLLGGGIISGNWRPSFPSTDYTYSDAHLLSGTIATILAFTLISGSKDLFCSSAGLRIGRLSIYLTIVCMALLSTGSRNGILILLLTIIYFSVTRNHLRYLGFMLLIGVPVILLLFDINNSVGNHPHFSRIFTTDIFQDPSIEGRLNKVNIGINEVQGLSVLFGRSIVNSDLLWYDNGPIILYVHFGLSVFPIILLISIALLNRLFLFRGFSRKQSDLLFFIFLIIMGNIVTEFFLTTRYTFPVFYALGILANDAEK